MTAEKERKCFFQSDRSMTTGYFSLQRTMMLMMIDTYPSTLIRSQSIVVDTWPFSLSLIADLISLLFEHTLRRNQWELMRDCIWWWLVIIVLNPSVPCLSDCSSLDIRTQSNLSEVEVVRLVQESIPRIAGSDFEPLSNTQIRALLDYYGKRGDSNDALLHCRTFFSVVQ